VATTYLFHVTAVLPAALPTRNAMAAAALTHAGRTPIAPKRTCRAPSRLPPLGQKNRRSRLAPMLAGFREDARTAPRGDICAHLPDAPRLAPAPTGPAPRTKTTHTGATRAAHHHADFCLYQQPAGVATPALRALRACRAAPHACSPSAPYRRNGVPVPRAEHALAPLLLPPPRDFSPLASSSALCVTHARARTTLHHWIWQHARLRHYSACQNTILNFAYLHVHRDTDNKRTGPSPPPCAAAITYPQTFAIPR